MSPARRPAGRRSRERQPAGAPGERAARGRSGWAQPFAAALAGADPGEDLVATGADLEPETLLDAYALGLFPMGLGGEGRPPLGWWSPDPRGVLPLDGFHESRSLRRSRRALTATVDEAFADVVDGCADPGRSGRWITPEVRGAYLRLHERGHARSVEVRDASGALVGGLYGVLLGGLFAGESMFSRAPDASKAALAALVDLLRDDGADGAGRLLDVQWRTEHLASLGVVEIPRAEYLRRLGAALELPAPPGLGGPRRG
ncbi:leucyl/phenylalanyl-tRNA--protein transferase [uncultured Pseudokineococcus sp.]|uniref:leucyl/phenylalanyl-tRNA--protein transferase n=1 Tax=uncultured Pseudokineococcus sp. TaxID=1642928 RepID=UPI00260ADF7A|nr:leucyl/phenylalanyl-tRNA--protein transferase [uncultured Pseudokineococcus sp.]